MAYIVRKSRALITADQILAYMAERTAKIKRITGGIIFTDEIPKNPVSSMAMLGTSVKAITDKC